MMFRVVLYLVVSLLLASCAARTPAEVEALRQQEQARLEHELQVMEELRVGPYDPRIAEQERTDREIAAMREAGTGPFSPEAMEYEADKEALLAQQRMAEIDS